MQICVEPMHIATIYPRIELSKVKVKVKVNWAFQRIKLKGPYSLEPVIGLEPTT